MFLFAAWSAKCLPRILGAKIPVACSCHSSFTRSRHCCEFFTDTSHQLTFMERLFLCTRTRKLTVHPPISFVTIKFCFNMTSMLCVESHIHARIVSSGLVLCQFAQKIKLWRRQPVSIEIWSTEIWSIEIRADPGICDGEGAVSHLPFLFPFLYLSHSPPPPALELVPPKPARRSGERCKLPQWIRGETLAETEFCAL